IAGASPVFITRAVVEELDIPVYLFNAGLLEPPTVPTIDLQGVPAKCLSQGAAMDLVTVQHLFNQGMIWGEKLSSKQNHDYLVIGECVVGGTTTALAVLTGLGIAAKDMVNSSHPVCNHAQKWEIVQAGLEKMIGREGERERGREGEREGETREKKQIQALQSPIQNPSWKVLGEENLHPKLSAKSPIQNRIDPLQLVAAVGDPMQVVVAGMAISASRNGGVCMAGGTQMLAVFALASAICESYNLFWRPCEVVVGTTRWVASDSTGNTVELAQQIGRKVGVTPSLLATELCFNDSRYVQLQAYEQGFVKEGMGAGGACIAAYLSKNWQQNQFIEAIEAQLDRYWQA
ncbi:MAG: nicotinate-nucleotide--dimethylbenzimidazole phosphoribosyltransferase, partial [Cyanobacteria bacterium J06643_5]